MEKELRVKKIKDGTVIDHLPAGSALYVLRILGIDKNYGETVSVVMNVVSKSAKVKDVVKIENRALSPEESNRLALIAPGATINIIKDYEVVEKNKVTVPEELVNTLRCANPNCITNQNEPVIPSFRVESKDPMILRCTFCGRIMDKELIAEQA